ncbi:tetratricopeptide repeat protein [Reyranella sp.]|uniref:tetratricopeptide repeat protein n=1 Tax=Reyranella sp. TaxID=1929291 RepID=UPI003D0B0BD0
MPLRAYVQPQPEPGHAVLRVVDLDALPEGLTLSIQRQQGPDTHLADDGWRRTEAWLQPEHVERVKGDLEFHLGPEICDRLAGIATIRLRVKEPDIGVVGTTVVAWPPMLTSGAVDPSRRGQDDTIRLRGRPQPEPPPPPPAPPFEPPPPTPMPDLRAARDPLPEIAPSRGRTGWMIAAVIVLALAGGGYFAYTNYFQKHEDEVAATPPAPTSSAPNLAATNAPRKSVRETVGEYLATNPAPDALLAKGKEFEQAGELNGAFLVWRRAAEAGSASAQLELAFFYDPLVTPSKAGFTPDGARAADWYERAALAGNPEAQRRYGLLLAKGGAGLPADPGRARSWLQQAAAQNDAEAKKALETLPK